jgi:hypothetical protein
VALSGGIGSTYLGVVERCRYAGRGLLREREDGHAERSVIYEDAREMPQGYWDFRGHHRDLLAHAESLGCARLGLPLLPEEMKRQREDGVPPPPD